MITTLTLIFLMNMKINMKYIQVLIMTTKNLIIFLNQNQNLKK